MITNDQGDQLWQAIRQEVGTYRTTTRGSWASRIRKRMDSIQPYTGRALPSSEDSVRAYVIGMCVCVC